MPNDKLDARLRRVYDNPGDKQALFDDWAPDYDHDLVSELGYVAHLETCRHFVQLVPNRAARVLDAGCGTGLVGQRLKEDGYLDLHGNDYSTKMLEQARATGAYRTLAQHDLTRPVPAGEPYDAAISVGVFAFSLPSAEHLVNLTAALKAGAYALVTVNGKAWRDVDWPAKLEGFEQAYPDMRLIETRTIDYLTAEGIDGRLLVLQRRA